MIIDRIAACPTDVLIKIARLHIKLFAAAIAQCQISPVLIKDLSIDGGWVFDQNRAYLALEIGRAHV